MARGRPRNIDGASLSVSLRGGEKASAMTDDYIIRAIRKDEASMKRGSEMLLWRMLATGQHSLNNEQFKQVCDAYGWSNWIGL